jgi:hypothetical protein
LFGYEWKSIWTTEQTRIYAKNYRWNSTTPLKPGVIILLITMLLGWSLSILDLQSARVIILLITMLWGCSLSILDLQSARLSLLFGYEWKSIWTTEQTRIYAKNYRWNSTTPLKSGVMSGAPALLMAPVVLLVVGMLVINFRSSECKSNHTVNYYVVGMIVINFRSSEIVINSMITLALWRSKIDNEHPHNIVINSMITMLWGCSLSILDLQSARVLILKITRIDTRSNEEIFSF